MEGTVTISLSDYECLKSNATNMKHYLNLASKQIELLERIEEAIAINHIDIDLIKDIDKALEIWHG